MDIERRGQSEFVYFVYVSYVLAPYGCHNFTATKILEFHSVLADLFKAILRFILDLHLIHILDSF